MSQPGLDGAYVRGAGDPVSLKLVQSIVQDSVSCHFKITLVFCECVRVTFEFCLWDQLRLWSIAER